MDTCNGKPMTSDCEDCKVGKELCVTFEEMIRFEEHYLVRRDAIGYCKRDGIQYTRELKVTVDEYGFIEKLEIGR